MAGVNNPADCDFVGIWHIVLDAEQYSGISCFFNLIRLQCNHMGYHYKVVINTARAYEATSQSDGHVSSVRLSARDDLHNHCPAWRSVLPSLQMSEDPLVVSAQAERELYCLPKQA